MGVVTKQEQPKLGLERKSDVLLKDYAGMAPETFSGLVPEERRPIMKILRLRVRVQPSAILEVSGTLGSEGGLGGCEPNSASGASTTASASSTGGSGSLRSALPSPVTRSSIPRLERLREKDHGRRVHGQGLQDLGRDARRRCKLAELGATEDVKRPRRTCARR
jgi:hypothetical protein